MGEQQLLIEELQHGGKGSGKSLLNEGESAGCSECAWVNITRFISRA